MNGLFADGRALPALLFGPLAAPLVYIAGVLILGEAHLAEPGAVWMLGVLVFIVAAPVAYAATLVLGLPLIWLLGQVGRLNLPVLLVASAALGGLVYLGFMAWLLQGMDRVAADSVGPAAWFCTGAILAASVAMAVWLIGGMGRLGKP